MYSKTPKVVMRYSYINLLFLIIVLILASACQPEPDSETIAYWENTELSEAVFKTQYVRYISTAPLKDSNESRKEFAQRLLERKIIANLARDAQFDTLKVIQETIERKRELEQAKQYIRSVVDPSIQEPTEEDIRQAFLRTNTRLKLQQIYAASKSDIKEYYARLENDSTAFEDLARESMRKAGESPNTFNMGWVSWNEMDLAPEEAAFQLNVGMYSQPVQSLAGWHIFKAVDKEQTFFADNTTYQNAKERLKVMLERRKFEEKSVQYIDSVLSETELALYPRNINQLWNYLAPKLPTSSNEIVAVLNREANTFDGENLPPDLTLAALDGTPFTVADFMKRLPNVPYWQLQPNLRPALESLLKDKLFSQKAVQNGFSDHPEVLKETEIEGVRILNLTYKSAVADTLNLHRISDSWFKKWKSNYIADQTAHINSYVFQDSLTARKFLQKFIRTDNRQEVLTEFKVEWEKQNQTLTSSIDSTHPVFGLINTSNTQHEINLWGPYNINGSWQFIEILSRENNYKEIDDVRSDLIDEMASRLSEITHTELLKKAGYRPQDVTFNEQLLESTLPTYFQDNSN